TVTAAVIGRFRLGVGHGPSQVKRASSHAFVVFRDERALGPGEQRADAAGAGRLHGGRLVFRLVADQHALVIPQDDGVVGGGNEVVGHERDLAAAVRAVHDVGGNAQARHVTAQTFHDLQPLPDTSAEVAGPDDWVAVEKVVGTHLDTQQGAEQPA